MNARLHRRAVCERGVTLVEIAIGLTIIAILMAMAVPSFNSWAQNSQIRSVSEGILGSVQLTRGQAIATNSLACIQFIGGGVASSTGTGWVVMGPTSDGLNPPTITPANCNAFPATGQTLEARTGSEGARNATVSLTATGGGGVATNPTFIEFGGLGQVTGPFPVADVTTIDVQNSGGACLGTTGGKLRCLRITVTKAGEVRMCDPDTTLASGDPRKC